MAQQTKPEAPQEPAGSRDSTDSLVRTVASKLFHFQLQRERRRTSREIVLIVAGVLLVAMVVAAVWYNWSAIVSLLDTVIAPSSSPGI